MTEAVEPALAGEASRAGFERRSAEHPFSTCFGCGPARLPGDGLRLFPGSLGDGRYAAPWTPDATLAAGDGTVRREYVWAALDCPTIAPVADLTGNPAAVLARLHAQIDGPVRAGTPHAVVSWPIGVDGRKRYAACAVFDAEGGLLALSEALWVELPGPPSNR